MTAMFRKISPRYTPGYAVQKGDLFIIREKILQEMLLIFAVIGIPTVVVASTNAIVMQEKTLPFLYVGIYLLYFLIMLARELPYALRGYILISAIYFLAVSELFESGQMGDLRMFLIAFTSLTAVLFNRRHVIAAVLLSLVTIAGVGIYATLVPDPIIPALAILRHGTNWQTSAITFLIISASLSGAITLIIAGLQSNLTRQHELARSLEYERDTLEQRVQERTRGISRAMIQLQAAAEISRTISALSDPETLLQQVVDLIQSRFDYYYVGIFLVDDTRQNAVLQAATGEAGRLMISEGYQIVIGSNSMIGWAIANRTSRVALDVGDEVVRFNNPRLPLTRSELALPIIVRDSVIGAMTIQSQVTNAFDANDIAILESVSDSIGVALENDHLYHQTRQSLEEIRALNHEYLQRAWSEAVGMYGGLTYGYDNPFISTRSQTQPGNLIDIPLTLRDETIGSLTLEVDRAELSSEEMAFVENVTTQTAIALENARLFENTVRNADREKKVMQITAKIRSTNNPEEMMHIALSELQQALKATRTQIYIRQDKPSAGTQPAGSPAGTGKSPKPATGKLTARD